MAKINKFVATYTDKFEIKNINFDNTRPPKVVMKRFIRLLTNIDDKRLFGMIEYPLEEIVAIAFLAILSGAKTWIDLESFGKVRTKWLKKFLKLEHGIPSHDTFRRVFGLIDPKQLESVTVIFIINIIEKIKKVLKIEDSGKRLINVDGKEQKGTGRKYNTTEEIRNLQTLHIYDASNEICLFSEIIEEKTNEIPVAQKALKLLNLKNAIVTFDALHTQRETINIINEQKSDYVGALKANQGTFITEAKGYFTNERLEKIREKGTNYFKHQTEKAHRQVETREYFSVDSKRLYIEKDWAGLKRIICYKKTMFDYINNKTKIETRYYISSLTNLETIADSIRGHWGVENKLHWHLDVNFGEDDNTTMDKVAFNNFSLINKMSLNILKLSKPVFKGSSIATIKKCFGWEANDTLSLILNFLTSDDIEKAITKSI